jgi:hypothetical protein
MLGSAMLLTLARFAGVLECPLAGRQGEVGAHQKTWTSATPNIVRGSEMKTSG